MYNLIAKPLQFFYELWPNYAGAISLLTLTIMILLLPLTLKGTRSMLAMQKLQPELKKIQAKYKDDRQKLNEEMMLFYKENNINPVSGCLPLLLQMPVFLILYRTLFQLLNRQPYGYDMGAAAARATNGVNDGIWEKFGYFVPKHLDTSSALYHDLSNTRDARSFGLSLAESASKALGDGIGHALPYILLVVAVTATSYIQQKQVSGRNTQTQINPQQQMLMRIMPLFFAFISFTLPSGIVIYFLVSNLFRVGQQALITRTMYRDQDGVVTTTGKAVDKSSTKGDPAPKPKGFFQQLKEIEPPNPNRAKREVQAAKAKQGASSSKGESSNGSATSSTTTAKAGAKPSRTAPSAANRSKSKKKRK